MCALTQAEQSLSHNYSREAHLCLDIQFYKGFQIFMLTKVRNFVGNGVGCVHRIWEHLCKWLLRRLYSKLGRVWGSVSVATHCGYSSDLSLHIWVLIT